MKVYPSLQRSPITSEAPPFDTVKLSDSGRNSLESWRAGAAQIWQSGADGVYLFNFLRPEHWQPMLREIGDPDVLARVDKIYYATVTSPGPEDRFSGLNRFANMPVLIPEKPLTVEPGKTAQLKLWMGDDLGAVVKGGLRPQVTTHLMAADNRNLTVRLNGEPLKEAPPERRLDGVSDPPRYSPAGGQWVRVRAGGRRE